MWLINLALLMTGCDEMPDAISGNVQTPIQTISPCDLYYDQHDKFCYSRAGNVSEVSELRYENVDFMVDTALVDPGCQEHLFKDIYHKYMNDTSKSTLKVYGFDGST